MGWGHQELWNSYPGAQSQVPMKRASIQPENGKEREKRGRDRETEEEEEKKGGQERWEIEAVPNSMHTWARPILPRR